MGVDIRLFIEYAREDTFSGSAEDRAIFLAEFGIGRDYALFDALGDARASEYCPRVRWPCTSPGGSRRT